MTPAERAREIRLSACTCNTEYADLCPHVVIAAALAAQAAQTRALETALGEAIDGYEELYLRFYPEGPKSICVPAWRAALTGAPRDSHA